MSAVVFVFVAGAMGFVAHVGSEEATRWTEKRKFGDQKSGEKAGPKRLREGELISNQTGIFRETGDRISFYSSGGDESMRVLENLALERVALQLDKTRDRRSWTVSGSVTEYRGMNYLLIKRAVLKGRTKTSLPKPKPPATAPPSTS